MKRLACFSLALGLVSTLPAAAQTAYFGAWTEDDPTICQVGSDSPQFAYLINNDGLLGLESTCAFTNPVAVRDMDATLYDMNCNGEGESWVYRAMFMTMGPDMLAIIRNGDVRLFRRCTTESGPGTRKP